MHTFARGDCFAWGDLLGSGSISDVAHIKTKIKRHFTNCVCVCIRWFGALPEIESPGSLHTELTWNEATPCYMIPVLFICKIVQLHSVSKRSDLKLAISESAEMFQSVLHIHSRLANKHGRFSAVGIIDVVVERRQRRRQQQQPNLHTSAS